MRSIVHQAGYLALALLQLVSGTPLDARATDPKCFPIVDLGYVRHQALTYNETSEVYKFSNIRYAQAPTGNLRWRGPVPPLTDRSTVYNGSETRTCPQGVPAWQGKSTSTTGAYQNNKSIEELSKPFNLTGWEYDMQNAPPFKYPWNANSNEDCLFLDVHVSKSVLRQGVKWKGKDGKGKGKGGAPVLIWIHGGGYTLGSKSGFPAPSYNPHGLLARAAADSPENMVYVALNYRLGALGFLSDPEIARNGDLNAGLLDQRLALQWVQDNIHLFGGDKDRVTVMGESAGGGSILLHLAAYGGKGPQGKAPFTNAIPQSPAYMPTAAEPATAYNDFLGFLNVSSLAQARSVSSAAVIAANEAHIASAPAVNYIFGPVVDGKFIPKLPAKSFREGHFDKSVKVLVAHNSFEGAFFFDPTVKTDADFKMWLDRSVVGLSVNSQKQIAENVYPPRFDATTGYVDTATRQMALWSEAVIDCNFDLIGDSLRGNSYAYQFSLSPGFHIQDTKYTFNDPTTPIVPELLPVQDTLQRLIVSFVQKGVPVMDDGKPFPKWGSQRILVHVTAKGTKVGTSPVHAERCAVWNDLKV